MGDEDFEGGFDDLFSADESLNSGEGEIKLTDFQRDSLRELSNIAAGMASRPLAEYVGSEIEIGLPFMDMVPVSNISMFTGGPEVDVVVANCKIKGLISGNMLTVFHGKSAYKLYDTITKSGSVTEVMSEDVSKALEDACSKVSVTYLNALADFLDSEFLMTSISFIWGKGGDLGVNLDLSAESSILLLETDFVVPDTDFEGDFILLTDEDSTKKLISSVDEKLG